MMNFIDPAKRNKRATRICAVQRSRLVVLLVVPMLDMVRSPLMSAAPSPEPFGRPAASHHHVEPANAKSTWSNG
jgi:hypothetical protein